MHLCVLALLVGEDFHFYSVGVTRCVSRANRSECGPYLGYVVVGPLSQEAVAENVPRIFVVLLRQGQHRTSLGHSL